MGKCALFLFVFEPMRKQNIRHELPETTVERIRAICHQHQAELIDYTVRDTTGSIIIELFIDNRDGVTHDLCQAISTDIEPLLESDPALSAVVRLDVSSPGVDRPLIYPWQYIKHNGRLLRVTTLQNDTYSGYLRSVSDAAITLESTAGVVTLPFTDIKQAVVQLEW